VLDPKILTRKLIGVFDTLKADIKHLAKHWTSSKQMDTADAKDLGCWIDKIMAGLT
jgi:hypothetical protein